MEGLCKKRVKKKLRAVIKKSGAVPNATGAVKKKSGAVPNAMGAVIKKSEGVTKVLGAIKILTIFRVNKWSGRGAGRTVLF